MPQSYTALYYHLIFSTRHRLPMISEGIASRLYSYIGGIIGHHGGILLAAGGTEDHLHLLTAISKQQSLSEALRLVKSGSSTWIHETFADASDFAWQSGYGAFSVSASNLMKVKRYIANQAEHHRTMTFQEEFLRFLRAYDVPYDERYIWK